MECPYLSKRMCVLQMNDVMLYTYPQQDGKYRLKNTLTLSGMKVRQEHVSADQICFLVNKYSIRLGVKRTEEYFKMYMCFHVSVGQ